MEYAVSYFKSHALSLLDDLSRQKSEEIIITKRGKPIARVLPITESDAFINTPGTMEDTLLGDNDILSPLGDDDWDYSL